jgi:hypothetical protein
MRIAGLVRKLLLDESRLVDQVNRSRRLKIRFLIDDAPPMWEVLPEIRPTFWSIQDGLDPYTSVTAPLPRDVTRDEFLRKVVMLVGTREITVRDVVSHVAHVGGDVHLGEPQDESQQALKATEGVFSIGGYPPDVRSLQAIGRIVLRALLPLRAEVSRSAA